ncbi:hypothetical protein EVAR_56888_1 [Eumeta japonica]|uniref:Uncharacterized protein n=1 Tax=Eumeta variegata TaxID=151549 RepID=A0A4C1ZHU6_EUMVA|nr:hypothetical protein EVAR_56888_1 [Eumeta japonica]
MDRFEANSLTDRRTDINWNAMTSERAGQGRRRSVVVERSVVVRQIQQHAGHGTRRHLEPLDRRFLTTGRFLACEFQ